VAGGVLIRKEPAAKTFEIRKEKILKSGIKNREVGPMNEESGFTIMELMVVIGIVAILAAIALPNFIGKLPAKRIESAASEVRAVFQVARLAAIKENSPAILQFDVNDESYSVRVSGRLVKHGKMPAGVDLKDVFLSNQTTPAPGGAITFNSRGFPTPSVDVFLQNTAGTIWTIQVNLTGSSRLIRG
jgi:prepilin-type N-terminal cleavage/methylation domain-containing protein